MFYEKILFHHMKVIFLNAMFSFIKYKFRTCEKKLKIVKIS